MLGGGYLGDEPLRRVGAAPAWVGRDDRVPVRGPGAVHRGRSVSDQGHRCGHPGPLQVVGMAAARTQDSVTLYWVDGPSTEAKPWISTDGEAFASATMVTSWPCSPSSSSVESRQKCTVDPATGLVSAVVQGKDSMGVAAMLVGAGGQARRSTGRMPPTDGTAVPRHGPGGGLGVPLGGLVGGADRQRCR